MAIRGSSAGRRAPRTLVLALIGCLIASHSAAASPVSAVAPSADPLAAHVPVPTRESIAAVDLDVPADPYAAAANLVDLVYSPDAATGSAAVTEILRRTGIPVVDPEGPVIAMPDDLVMVDAITYDGSVADIARSVRRGDGWALDAFTDGLKGSEAIADFVQPGQMAAVMGDLGRAVEDPLEVKFAGAVLRGLSGHRGEVLYLDASPDQLIDPLQWTLLLSMWTSDVDRVVPGTGSGVEAVGALAGGVEVAGAGAGDPCAAAVKDLKDRGAPATAEKDIVKEIVKNEIKKIVPKSAGKNPVGNGFDVWDKGTSALALAILLMGMTMDLTTDKNTTHFKHRGGDRGPHVHLKATNNFDSALAQKRLNCYKLAGIAVRPNGPQAGFRVMWDLDQPAGSYSQYGFGANPFPLFQQGRLLAPISAHSYKIGKLGSRGLAGEITGRDGQSTLELYPPVEKKPGQGAELYGNVRVTAALTQDDMPKLFKITDPTSVIKEAGNGVPIKWAVKKTIDLALSYLSRAGLPKEHTTIRVGYHGADVYVVKGSGTAFLFFYTSPYEVDLYTCDGLRTNGNAQGQITGGRWKGSAKFGDDRIIDPTVVNALIKAAAGIFHTPDSQLPQLPEHVNFENQNVDQVLDLMSDPSIGDEITLIDPLLHGQMIITNPPPEQLMPGPGGTVLTPQHINGPVGTIELFLDTSSLDTLGQYFGGLWTAKFTIQGVPQDPRCPGSGPDDYYYEAI